MLVVFALCVGSFACEPKSNRNELFTCTSRHSARSERMAKALRASGPATMKPSALRIERMLEKIEVPPPGPPRKWLRVIIDGDDEAEAKEKALAEHVARHPEDVGRTVDDFNWILETFVRPAA